MSQAHDVLPDPSPAPEPKLEPTPAPAPTPEPTPGSKTPPENLLAALQDEREKNKKLSDDLKIAEEALKRGVEPSHLEVDEWSAEGQAIIDRFVKPLTERVSSLTEELTLKDLVSKYPALKDMRKEFDEYRKGKPGVTLDDAAKLFLADNNLLAAPVRRKGLETPKGGERTPISSEMTTEEITDLRKNNYKKYLELLEAGKIPLGGK